LTVVKRNRRRKRRRWARGELKIRMSNTGVLISP
jgi:hypothetical protein